MKKIIIIVMVIAMVTALAFGIVACNNDGTSNADLKAQIEALQKQLDEVKGREESLNELRDYIDGIDVVALRAKIAELEKIINEPGADIGKIKSGIEELKKIIESICEQFFTIERNRNSLEFNVSFNFDLFESSDVKMELVKNGNVIDSQVLSNITQKVALTAPNFGKYTVNVSGKKVDGKSFKFECTYKLKESHYNLAYMNATLPVAMFSSRLCLDTASSEVMDPTFVYLERTQTYDWDKLPANVHKFGTLEDVSKYNFTIDITKAMDFVLELAEMDKNSTFTVNVTDNHVNLITAFMECNGIDSTRYNARIWTDGGGTYSLMHAMIKDKAELDMRIEKLNKHLENALAGSRDEHIAMRETPSLATCAVYALPFTSRSNVEYIVNSVDGLYNNDAVMKQYVKDHLSVITLNEMLSNIKANEKAFSDFEYLFQTRQIVDGQEISISKIFDKSDKPNLLILGTSPGGENAAGKPFMEFYEKLKEMYGAQYDIFYKAHPGFIDLSSYTDGRAERFKADGVVNITPGTIPVELFMFFYPDVYICGYSGSSFYSSQAGQTICFFQSKSSVSSNTTLKSMMDSGIFNNTKYLYDEMMQAN